MGNRLGFVFIFPICANDFISRRCNIYGSIEASSYPFSQRPVSMGNGGHLVLFWMSVLLCTKCRDVIRCSGKTHSFISCFGLSLLCLYSTFLVLNSFSFRLLGYSLSSSFIIPLLKNSENYLWRCLGSLLPFS